MKIYFTNMYKISGNKKIVFDCESGYHGPCKVYENGLLKSIVIMRDGQLSGEQTFKCGRFQLTFHDDQLVELLEGSFKHKFRYFDHDKWFVPMLNLIFYFDLGSFEIKSYEPNYPMNGEYQDALRWISFKDGKISLRANKCYSLKQGYYYFKIDGYKIIKASKGFGNYYDCHEDGYCPKLKARFVINRLSFYIDINETPFPTDGEFSTTFRWINFSDGKISTKKSSNMAMRNQIDDKVYYFSIEDNIIRRASINGITYHDVFNGDCPGLGMRFKLNLEEYLVEGEKIEVRNQFESFTFGSSTPAYSLFESRTFHHDDNQVIKFEEDTEEGKIVYHTRSGKVFQKDYYIGSKLRRTDYL